MQQWKIRTSVRQIECVEDERIHPPACHSWNTSKPGIHALCHDSHYHSVPFLHLASNHLAIGGKFAVDIMIIVSKKVPSTLKYSSTTPVQQYQVIEWKIHIYNSTTVFRMYNTAFCCVHLKTH